MDITVSCRHTQISNESKDYIIRKIEPAIDTQSLKVSSVKVIVDNQKNRYSVEVVVNAKHVDVEAVAESYNLYEAVDEVSDKVDKQIKKYLGKKHDHHKKPLSEEFPEKESGDEE